MGLVSLVTEIRRRRVFRMTAWYIVASWVLIQVASEALPALDLDERFIKYFWLAALGGFPIALIFSWRYDVTIDGIKRTATGGEISAEELRLGRVDYFLLLVLGVLAAFGVYNLSQTALEEVAVLEVAPEFREIKQQSIAILPLENLSPESTESYFVSGMYDSLISNLGKINALQVTSRTSASRVNTSQGIPYVGRKLGVRYVIEGACSGTATGCAYRSNSSTRFPTSTSGPKPTNARSMTSWPSRPMSPAPLHESFRPS